MPYDTQKPEQFPAQVHLTPDFMTDFFTGNLDLARELVDLADAPTRKIEFMWRYSRQPGETAALEDSAVLTVRAFSNDIPEAVARIRSAGCIFLGCRAVA